MKTTIKAFIAAAVFLVSFGAFAQTVAPARQTIDKTEYSGLNLSTSIPEKNLKEYWTTYLSKYGKLKSKRGAQSLEKAYIPEISKNSLNLTSAISSSRNISTIFLSLQDGPNTISSASDAGYLETEQFLKQFLTYATSQEELRLVKEDFSKTQDERKKLIREKDRLTKDIEKAEKELVKLREDLAKKETELTNYNSILENKQKGLKEVESKKSNK
jgi:chromosome segregation ATPase